MRGADYFLKRTLFALVTVFVAITLNFVIFRATPGDAVTGLRCQFCTLEFKEQLRAELGLDKSKWEQYVLYLQSLAQGDMGRSFVTREPVVDELVDPLLNTLPMIALGTAFSIVFGVLAGVVAAWRRGTFLDWGNLSFSLLFYSLPTQWLGLMLLIAFAGTLPASGISDPFLEFTDPSWWETFVDRLEHMILPAATIGIVLFGEYALIVRSSLLEALERGLRPHRACEGPPQLGHRLEARVPGVPPPGRDADRSLARVSRRRSDPRRGRLLLPWHRPRYL